jgi:hypothetical protein
MQPARALDVRETRRLGRYKVRSQAKLFTQCNSVPFLHEERIGPGVDRVSVDLFAQHDAAWARGTFEDERRDLPPLQFIGNRQARDPSADDDGVSGHRQNSHFQVPFSPALPAWQ